MTESERLDTIFGRRRFSTLEMSEEARATMVTEALARFRPYLSDLPGFESLQENILRYGEMGDDFVHDPAAIDLPPTLGFETQCFRLDCRRYVSTQEPPASRGSRGASTQRIEQQELFLTQLGKLVVWDLRFERLVSSSGEQSSLKNVSLYRFFHPAPEELRSLLTAERTRRILFGLENLTQARVRVLEARLKESRALEQYISGICSHLKKVD